MNLLTKLARHKTALTLVAVVAFALLMMPAVVMGAVDAPCDADTPCDAKEICKAGKCEAITVGFGLGYGAETGLGAADVRSTVAQIINVALGLLGIVAVVIILWGGFKWMTAGGNEERVTEARKLIFAGIIGLAIILSAYAIAKFVIQQLAVATEAQTTF